MQKLPQLTLRDLFWLVALVAMGCGWWIHSRQQAGSIQHLLIEQSSLQERIERLEKSKRAMDADIARAILRKKQIDEALAKRGWKYDLTEKGVAVWHFLDEPDLPRRRQSSSGTP